MGEKRTNIEDELAAVFGLSAEDICTRKFQCNSDMHRIITGAARAMKNNSMNGWTYSGMHPDGTTIWQSPEGGHYARVTRDGAIDSEY